MLSRADVEAALDLDALVDELAAAFAALSAGEASMPPRTGVEVPGAGSILLMGAHRHGSPSVTVKLVSIFPGHDPAHQAAIVVFDAATGTPAALMDGDAITAARTAAGSRLATRLLAREDADVLAVIGTGVQGEAHLRALRREREWAESASGAGARKPPARSPSAPRRHVGAVGGAAVHGAGVVCVATPATEPVAPPRVARPRRARQLGRLLDRGPRARPRARARRARRRRVARVRARPAARRRSRPRGRGRATPSSASSWRAPSRAARARSS